MWIDDIPKALELYSIVEKDIKDTNTKYCSSKCIFKGIYIGYCRLFEMYLATENLKCYRTEKCMKMFRE